MNNGMLALVDEADFEKISKYNWSITKNGYAQSNIGKKTIVLMHRLIMNAQTGQTIDHADGNKLNNRLTNLRFCTRSQNNVNSKLPKNNTSGFKGVTVCGNKFRTILAGKHIGMFDTAIEAAKAYDAAAQLKYPGFALINVYPVI